MTEFPRREADILLTPGSEALRFLPEGPRPLQRTDWLGGGDWLSWVAIQHGPDRGEGSINLLNLDTGENVSFTLPGRPGFLLETDRPGLLLAGLERELSLVDISGDSMRLTHTGLRIEEHEHTVINDGIPTPFGIIFGTKDVRFQEGIGHLYLYRHGDSELTVLRDGQTCSNGKIVQEQDGAWTLYDIDTPTKKVVAYALDLEAGSLDEARTVVDFAGEDHFPDGMRATPDGQSLVVSFYNPNDVAAGCTRQVNLSSGKTEEEWLTPNSPRATCPAFIERNGRIQLVITTADEGMEPELRSRRPNAGCLFIADTAFSAPLPAAPLVQAGSLPG